MLLGLNETFGSSPFSIVYIHIQISLHPFFFFCSFFNSQMKLDQTDEGYVEQRFDEPHFMKGWTDDQKAGKIHTIDIYYEE